MCMPSGGDGGSDAAAQQQQQEQARHDQGQIVKPHICRVSAAQFEAAVGIDGGSSIGTDLPGADPDRH